MMKPKQGKNVIILNTHPIQYFAPLYKYAAEQGLPLEVWYCSDESLRAVKDTQFGVDVKWDIPLLEGYRSRFFKNHSWKPSHFNGFFGLINMGVWGKLITSSKSVVIIYGWSNLTFLLAFMFAALRGHTVCLRAETPWNQERLKGEKNIRRKKFLLGKLLFSFIDRFLYIGTQNKLFYQNMGVKEDNLFYTPYAVDNQRFQQAAAEYLPQKDSLRQKFDIPAKSKIVLYSGKYMQKKRPLDLLKAFQLLHDENAWLLMVGDGELRTEMDALIKKENIKNVLLTGFINQSEIPKYYAMADVFVMCSEVGETWGLSVNEAMNFNLPVIVTDICGCSGDLVQPGKNGFIYPCGEIEQLTACLKQVLEDIPAYSNSREIIDRFSFEVITKSLQAIS